MKIIKLIYLSNFLLFLVVTPVHTELIDKGNGLIYDTDRDITWLQDANYAYTSEYDSDGLMNWADAMAWADSLVFGGYTDWRLPSPYNPDSSGPDDGSYVTGSEMGHLYYIELGNPYPGVLTNTGPFINIQPNMYWTNTHHATLPDRAWSFSWVNGGTGHTNDWQDDQRAWAVRDGDVVPTIDAIINFIITHDIDGAGPGNSADNRYNTFLNMLNTVADLIDAGDNKGVCGHLNSITKKCDGESKPPDFIDGAPQTMYYLMDMLTDLTESLGCE